MVLVWVRGKLYDIYMATPSLNKMKRMYKILIRILNQLNFNDK